MTTSADLLTTRQVAVQLDVSTRRVQQLLAAGELRSVARGVVDATSVDRYRASAHGGRTRVWSEWTAWGAVALLSGLDVDWLGATQVSRLRTALRAASVQDLVVRTRGRAVVRTLQVHPSGLRRIAADLVTADGTALGLSAVGGGADVSGYCGADDLGRLISAYALEDAVAGNVTLRATTFDLAVVRRLATSRIPVLTALDAAVAPDPRARGVATETLGAALERYRR